MNRNYFLELIGFGYLINHNTKEIHRVKTLTPSCLIYLMKNYGYGTKIYVWFLINFFGYNGCAYCFKEEDKG